MTHPLAWIAVNRAALRHNFAAVQAHVSPEGTVAPKIIAVVKANGYGHGAVETARVFAEAGADMLAVTTPDEALELRSGGVTARILMFLPPLPEQVEDMAAADLDVSLMDDTALAELAAAAKRLDRPTRVHLKVDTGMGRLGVLPDGVLALARQIVATPGVVLAGTYTHFARALEPNSEPTRRQFALFQRVLTEMQAGGIDPGWRHCANSAALLRFPEMRLDAVRPGTILYGQYPSAAVPRALALRDTWRLQARIVAVRDVPAGTAVGYGGEFVTRRPTKLAVLPMGYADGFTVAPASATSGRRGLKTLLHGLAGRGPSLMVTVRGQAAPIVGRVAMQICSADVTDIPGVAAGDVVDVPARRITASARLPRVYED